MRSDTERQRCEAILSDSDAKRCWRVDGSRTSCRMKSPSSPWPPWLLGASRIPWNSHDVLGRPSYLGLLSSQASLRPSFSQGFLGLLWLPRLPWLFLRLLGFPGLLWPGVCGFAAALAAAGLETRPGPGSGRKAPGTSRRRCQGQRPVNGVRPGP